MQNLIESEINAICEKINQEIYEMSFKRRLEISEYLGKQVIANYLMLNPKHDVVNIADILGVEPNKVNNLLLNMGYFGGVKKEPINESEEPIKRYKRCSRVLNEVMLGGNPKRVFEIIVEKDLELKNFRVICQSDLPKCEQIIGEFSQYGIPTLKEAVNMAHNLSSVLSIELDK